MNLPLTQSQFRILTVSILVLVSLLAYWNTFSGEFVWDDASSVLLHKHVQDPGKILQLFREDQHAFGRGQGNFYRPLLSVSFMADYALSRPAPGEDPGVFLFHLSSLFWHTAAALFLFFLLARLSAPRYVQVAVPLLFVVHPLHTEAVAYISGRGDPMSAAFMFAALVFALWQSSPRTRVAGVALSGLCFTAGLLSKESAFILPALLALFAVVRPRIGVKPAYDRPWTALAVSCVLLAVYAGLRFTVLDFGSDTTPRDITYAARLVEVLQAFALYIRLVFIPTGLHMERVLTDAPVWLAGVGAVLLVAVIGAMVWALRTGRRRVALGFGWFLLTWLPISGLFPLNAPMAEHWMYVPLAGLLWALTEIACGLTGGRRTATGLGLAATYAVCVVFLGFTVARNRDWRSNEALFRATLEENPGSIRTHFNLAVAYEDLLDNPPGARRHFEQVLDLYRRRKAASGDEKQQRMFYIDELEAHLSLGMLYLEDEIYDAAAQHFSVLLSIQPSEQNRGLVAEAALGLGRCYTAIGRPDAAKQAYQKAVEIMPELRPRVAHLLDNA